jgi:hypothetical protein
LVAFLVCFVSFRRDYLSFCMVMLAVLGGYKVLGYVRWCSDLINLYLFVNFFNIILSYS